MRRVQRLDALALLFMAACFPQFALTQQVPAGRADTAWRQELDAWRAHYEREISAPDGWLTLIGLEWLKPGINTFGSAAGNSIPIHAQAPDRMGMLTVIGKTVQLLSPAGGFPAGMQVDGKAAREGTLNVSDTNPSTIAWHGLTLVVLLRGDRFVLRIKDADSPTRAAFRGLHWYALDANYRVTARWIPYKPRQIEPIATVIGTTLNMTAPGAAEFLLNGKVLLLEPVLEGGDASKLFFILRDTTSTTTTYGGGRFLTTGLPDHGLDQPGSLTLDFNELYNPPCAYTPYATCPLPPQKNRLPVAIEAGEQRYEH
ncbi:MAG: DUF1684 domain-containing protein [Acidobacteriota bacterium]|nr:DUF1684 domain-containing protein [Acidobacteriota bacterium]